MVANVSRYFSLVIILVLGMPFHVVEMSNQADAEPACSDYESCLELIDQLQEDNALLERKNVILGDFIFGLGYNPTLVINAGMVPDPDEVLVGLSPEELVPYSEGNLYSFTQIVVCGNTSAINEMIQEQLAQGGEVDQFVIYTAISGIPTYDPILGKVYTYNDAVKAFILTWETRGIDKSWALDSPDFTLVRAFNIEAKRGLYNAECGVDFLIEKAKGGN